MTTDPELEAFKMIAEQDELAAARFVALLRRAEYAPVEKYGEVLAARRAQRESERLETRRLERDQSPYHPFNVLRAQWREIDAHVAAATLLGQLLDAIPAEQRDIPVGQFVDTYKDLVVWAKDQIDLDVSIGRDLDRDYVAPTRNKPWHGFIVDEKKFLRESTPADRRKS